MNPLRFRAAMLALAIGCALGAVPVSAATPVATPVTQPALEPVTDAYRQEFAADLSALPRYVLDLVLDDQSSTLGGTLTLTYPNLTGERLTEVPLRIYPNADYYAEGKTTIASIDIEGQAVAPRFDDSETVLYLDLPTPLEPEETLTATIEFSTVVPRNADGSFGILNHDVGGKRFVLADWYPVVAGRDETGWRLEPPTEQGDPTFSATSVFDVRLRVPQGYTVVSTGTETVLDDATIQLDSGPAREFAMVIAENLTTLTKAVGDTEVAVHVAPEHLANGQHVLDLATAALAYYDSVFGPYLYDELDFVETPLSLAYGVSWSGILFIDSGQLALPADSLASLDFTILHEIGHQWWGGTVGANSNDHTWMVEGLTNATAVLAQSAIAGQQAATDSLYGWIVGPYLNLLDGSGDAVADISIFDQPVDAPLSTLAYGKGALGFLAIRIAIGHDAFMQALSSYADEFLLGIADPDDLLAAFEAASGQGLDDLWVYWFQSAVTTRADVEELVPQIVATL